MKVTIHIEAGKHPWRDLFYSRWEIFGLAVMYPPSGECGTTSNRSHAIRAAKKEALAALIAGPDVRDLNGIEFVVKGGNAE